MPRASIVDLVVNLIGNDASLLAATKRSAAALEGVAGKSTKVADKIKNMGKMSAVALLAIGTYSVEAAAKFQQQMMLIHTQAGASTDAVKALSQQVLDMASQVGQSPDELAKGLYHIMSAGFGAKESIDILHAAAVNASMGLTDMESSAQGIIGVLAAGMPDIKNAADAAAFLNTTVGIGDMRFQQLNKSIATGVLSTFKVAGLGAIDYGAALATMTDNVVPANVAATRLRMAIALLAGPSNAAIAALKSVGLGANDANKAFAHRSELEKYGINLSVLSADLRKPNGLLVAIEDLRDHLKKSGLTAVEQTAVINRAFGGGRTSAGIQQLLSEIPRLEDKYNKLGTSTSRLKTQQQAWADQQKTLKQQTHELGAAITVMAIKLGNVLLPPLTKFVNFLVTHQGAMVAFFTVIIIMLGLFTVAWISMSAAMLADPVTWIIIAIIVAVAALAFGIYELVKHWKTVWNWIKKIAADVWGWLKSAWEATWNFMKGVAHWVMKYVVDPIVAAWNWLVKAAKATWHAIENAVIWVIVHVFLPMYTWINKYIVIPFHKMMSVVTWIFKFIAGFVGAMARDLFKFVDKWLIKPLVAGWHEIAKWGTWLWDKLVAGFKLLWKGLQVIWGYIKRDVIDKIMLGIKVARIAWDIEWGKIKSILNTVWDFFKKIWGYIKTGYDSYIVNPLKNLKKWWDQLWAGIKKTISDLWDKTLGPIFNKISGAIDKVINGFKNLGKMDPGKLGSSLWKGITGFFDKGGRVPGPVGAPQLAVVHGGEYVVSNDMQRGVAPMRGFGAVLASGPSPYAVSGAGGGGGYDHIVVNISDKTLFDIIVARSQRNKHRNTSTFLT